ncbi:MAG: pre-peptidase C-terminal domain-containing protein, partial [Acidobacteria bacterium]|nr:pre-peptidase C-terminal domain-containing protein [Acidobacteriota bacterium]
MRAPRTLLPLLLLMPPAVASADFTTTGTCMYRDREFDETGFTGVEPSRPIRFADVEVLDNNLKGSRAILATGSTDASGGFSLFVADTKVRDIVVRCLTSTTYSPDYYLSTTNLAQNETVYAIVSPVFPDHSSDSDLNAGELLAVPGSGGEPFNIFDTALDALDYLAFLNGAPLGPSEPLQLKWEANTGNPVSAFDLSSATITVGDEAAYDDTIILHEIGHFAVYHFSDRDSPGGLHRLSDCNQDIRLAFDEGFASFFGNSVRRWKGYPRPEIYVNTNGMPGSGNLDFYFSLETETPFSCDGSTSEVSVYTALWDIADGPCTPDETPGADEPFDFLALDDRELWEVMTDYIPTASWISLEDFWDGWFGPGISNGFGEEMIAVFDEVIVEFYPDAFEENGTTATARPVAVTGLTYHNTFFSDPEGDYVGAPDTDYFAFGAVAGGEYVIETLNLLSDANTYLRLREPDGSTVLAENNDRSSGDPSSLISFTATADGTYFVEAFHASDFGVYGSYDFRVTAQGGPDQDGDGYDISVDCDDQNPEVHPAAPESCNGADDDCDGLIDENFDQDADGVTICEGDCDDNDTLNFPGNPEICDGRDNDCDGVVDEGFDADGDGATLCGGDCDDADPAIHSGAAEICNALD